MARACISRHHEQSEQARGDCAIEFHQVKFARWKQQQHRSQSPWVHPMPTTLSSRYDNSNHKYTVISSITWQGTTANTRYHQITSSPKGCFCNIKGKEGLTDTTVNAKYARLKDMLQARYAGFQVSKTLNTKIQSLLEELVLQGPLTKGFGKTESNLTWDGVLLTLAAVVLQAACSSRGGDVVRKTQEPSVQDLEMHIILQHTKNNKSKEWVSTETELPNMRKYGAAWRDSSPSFEWRASNYRALQSSSISSNRHRSHTLMHPTSVCPRARPQL
ncbi:hypothetical protein BO86DRAFT_424290 [Aspergillus japonicus CBS 114.51]|uniref:Uncharacterized protein n=1 Tax=Aspergillus japonicus CBS 114.51 TaxID=1448312 RepID=A0A8T8XHQ1_ASPJA|nr:hypothetical protein BO86DRAFT_424290 [Aspergillus japonicus CBS 114.51]RAH87571.1 hypothetical protein BO86DRAFT_424290 [Aspergillus japonicus CBS 114.51]